MSCVDVNSIGKIPFHYTKTIDMEAVRASYKRKFVWKYIGRTLQLYSLHGWVYYSYSNSMYDMNNS